MGLAHDIELTGRNAQRLGFRAGFLVVGRIPDDQAYIAVAGATVVPQQIVDVTAQHRHLGREVLGHEELDRDEVVDVADDITGRPGQGVRLARCEVEAPADHAAEEIHHDQGSDQNGHAESELFPGLTCGGQLPPHERGIRQR